MDGLAGIALYLQRVSVSAASGTAVTFHDILVEADSGDPAALADTLADGTIKARGSKRWVTTTSLSARRRPC